MRTAGSRRESRSVIDRVTPDDQDSPCSHLRTTICSGVSATDLPGPRSPCQIADRTESLKSLHLVVRHIACLLLEGKRQCPNCVTVSCRVGQRLSRQAVAGRVYRNPRHRLLCGGICAFSPSSGVSPRQVHKKWLVPHADRQIRWPRLKLPSSRSRNRRRRFACLPALQMSGSSFPYGSIGRCWTIFRTTDQAGRTG